LLHELVAAGPHKAVVFSQWELMLRQTAARLDRLGLGYVLLSGSVPAPERPALLERFRDDPHCRVFLSTDAGGTGLNLQAADTVVNLEVPWNPAVREQRVARVHRLGQSRPVQVINFVTRGSIEERVLHALEQKQALFQGLFTGDSDEVDFAALGQPGLLTTVRAWMADDLPAAPTEAGADPRQALLAAGVSFLEALAAVVGTAPGGADPELCQRAQAALEKILRQAPPPQNP